MKLVVILGPTASGKSDLAVKLANKYNGEIVSADSRQVYKGLDIGSGKITKKEMAGIPHHLLDVASPRQRFTVSRYQKLARAAIKKIQAQGKMPFLVGGTGLYAQSVLDGIFFPDAKPSHALRARLEKKSVTELFSMLKNIDPARAATIDAKNPRRLIRAIEIVKTTGKPVPNLAEAVPYRGGSGFKTLQIGIKKSPAELKKIIAGRLHKKLNKMIAEVQSLHRNGLSWRRLEELGLEYRFTAQYLQSKLSLPQMVGKIQIESEHFAKRQMTWFKRDKQICWVKNKREAERLIQIFIQ